MPKSIIKSINFKRELTSSYGTSFIYTILLEDGIKGDYVSKTQDNLPTIGQEFEYEYTPNAIEKYDGQLKEIKKKDIKSFSFKKNERGDNARTAILVAKDLLIAEKATGFVTEIAETIFSWLEKKTT